MTAHVIRADSRTLPLADNTVDLVVTSPPYFGLRSYQDGGKHYDGQVGDEATPAEFVDALLAVTAECVRVLKPTGSLWVNLGDKYSGYNNNGAAGRSLAGERIQRVQGGRGPGAYAVPNKSLIGLPWRYALRCIDDLGLILRAEVIWSKPNGLPESVTDRVRRSHEQWFHFTLEPRYFSAVDEVREPHVTPKHVLDSLVSIKSDVDGHNTRNRVGEGRHKLGTEHPLGKLPGSVWTIPTQPLQVPASLGVDHFAAFPMEWPRRIIKGWSPSGICVACGEGRRPTTQRDPVDPAILARRSQRGQRTAESRDYSDSSLMRVNLTAGESPGVRITGESCACPTSTAPTRPATVIDPFGGTGTTALVADALGRRGLSFDLSHDYSRLARWRTTDPGQRAAAMQVEKPRTELEGQADLFDGLSA